VGRAVAYEQVFARAAAERVRAQAAVDGVVAGAAHEDIVGAGAAGVELEGYIVSAGAKEFSKTK